MEFIKDEEEYPLLIVGDDTGIIYLLSFENLVMDLFQKISNNENGGKRDHSIYLKLIYQF